MAPETERGTPQAAAVAWVEAVMDRSDLAAAWPLTDPTLRLVLAQDWVWNHRHELAEPGRVASDGGWEAIAHGLAGCPCTHPLWDRFAFDVVARRQQIWKGFSALTWEVRGQPEVLGLDMEMVTFVEADEAANPTGPGRHAFARRFAMVHTDGQWMVASINGDQLFLPGWPPSLGRQGQP